MNRRTSIVTVKIIIVLLDGRISIDWRRRLWTCCIDSDESTHRRWNISLWNNFDFDLNTWSYWGCKTPSSSAVLRILFVLFALHCYTSVKIFP